MVKISQTPCSGEGKMTKQNIVLEELYKSDKEMTVEEIKKYTKLTIRQIHRALERLEERGLIKKRKISANAKYNIPPENKIYVKIKESTIPRIKTLLKNG